ncbi:MAG: hypothetical protein IT343_06900 [Candidatus Melainabacteria bacterium]|jgi:hypothetical protein|nr:hypothetical protein [Candidatus Melainabacteria bacterium]
MKNVFLSLAALSLITVQQVGAIPMVNGDEAASRVRQLATGIEWHTDLSQALNEGARSGKPVVWIHMLGKIDGAT